VDEDAISISSRDFLQQTTLVRRVNGGVLTAIVPPLSPGYADFHLLRVANCEVAYAAYPNGGVIINVLLYKQKLRNG